MRPLNEREKNSGQDKIFQVDRNTVSQIYHGQPVENQVYNYDKVFDESASTREVYSHIAKDIVTGVLNGINGTIFACKFSVLRHPIVFASLSHHINHRFFSQMDRQVLERPTLCSAATISPVS
jgi:hypothetical protein